MYRRPPRSTRTDTLFPYTTLFRSEPVDGPHERHHGDLVEVVGRLSPTGEAPGAVARQPEVVLHELVPQRGVASATQLREPLLFDRPLIGPVGWKTSSGVGSGTSARGRPGESLRSEQRRVGEECVSTRSTLVTGVQTCALPISSASMATWLRSSGDSPRPAKRRAQWRASQR